MDTPVWPAMVMPAVGRLGRRRIAAPALLPTITSTGGTLCLAIAVLTLLLFGFAFAEAEVFPYYAAGNVASIALERGVCYGTCPAYRLTFRADGEARYEGRAFVRLRGSYEARFNRRTFARFADALARRGFFAARASGALVVDAPRTTVSVAFADGTRADTAGSINFQNNDVSDDLYAAALLIEGFAGHICGWHQVGAPPPAREPASYAPISASPCTAAEARRLR